MDLRNKRISLYIFSAMHAAFNLNLVSEWLFLDEDPPEVYQDVSVFGDLDENNIFLFSQN